jgi:hypothetical protein
MTGQGAKERNRATRQVPVVCNWSYSKETTLGFRKLISRLLQPRRDQMEMDNGHKDDATG